MADETTTWVPLADLKPWVKNARRHSDDSTRKLAAGIRRFGFLVPLTAWRAEQRIAAGHGRRLAMQALLSEDPTFVPRNAPPGTAPGMVPVMWEDFASERQFEAFAISDNRQAKNAEDDEQAIAEVLRALEADGLDFDGMGFDDDELDDLLALAGDEATEPDEADDDVPEVEEGEADSQLGEVYQLGPHLLFCGSCLDEDIATRAAEGADACVTDPPYGTGINASAGLGNSSVPMNLLGDADPTLARAAFRFWSPRAPMQIWWGANYYADATPGSACWLVWDKDHHGMTFADAELAYTNSSRPVRVFRHAWSGNHRASERNVQREHPTQKPVALYRWLYEQHASDAEIIVDPFGGSGSSLIAAAACGRVARLIELDPRYCDVIRRRWTRWAREHNRDPGSGALD